MSVSTIRSSDPLNNDLFPLETPKLLRSSTLAKGKKLAVSFDFIRCAHVIVHEDTPIQEIPFCDSGIPYDLRFRCTPLSCYLEDTYDSFDGTKVLSQGRIKGGAHTSDCIYSSSSCFSPPPPKRIPINYSAGFLITDVLRLDIVVGVFKEKSGEAGYRHYSVIFETYNAKLLPSITLSVSKSEYYAREILKLREKHELTISTLRTPSEEDSGLKKSIITMQTQEDQQAKRLEQKRKECKELKEAHDPNCTVIQGLEDEIRQLEVTIEEQHSEVIRVRSIRDPILNGLTQLEQEISIKSDGTMHYHTQGGPWQVW